MPINPFWGPVALDGKTFEQMKVYQDIKKRIETVVNLPAFTDELFPLPSDEFKLAP
jgi:hypothetical protein